MMTKSFVARVESVGPGDLSGFRNAVLTYCQALRSKQPFHCRTNVESAKLLRWLGIEWVEVAIDQGLAESSFPQDPPFPEDSLSSFRERGFLGSTLFAALIRSSYGPDEPGYFPTASELGFYYDEALLREQIRWDEEYLAECQEFFFEELTPAEMLEQATALLELNLQALKERFHDELLGVVFLIGEQETDLSNLSRFLGRLLQRGSCEAEFRKLVSGLNDWGPDSLRGAWISLDNSARTTLEESFFGSYCEQADDILVACGENLLRWRADL